MLTLLSDVNSSQTILELMEYLLSNLIWQVLLLNFLRKIGLVANGTQANACSRKKLLRCYMWLRSNIAYRSRLTHGSLFFYVSSRQNPVFAYTLVMLVDCLLQLQLRARTGDVGYH